MTGFDGPVDWECPLSPLMNIPTAESDVDN